MSAYIKALLRQFKGTMGRFLSIAVISALGVGAFAGIRSVSPDMRLTAGLYYEEYALMDMQVLSTLGFSEDDIDAFKAFDPDLRVEATYAMDALAQPDEEGALRRVVKLHALLEEHTLNIPLLIEGRLPEKPYECAVSETMAGTYGFVTGSRTILESGMDDPITDFLASEVYTVTGVVRLPQYISDTTVRASVGDGAAVGFLLLPEAAFITEAYTCVYLGIPVPTGIEGGSDAYYDYIEEYEAALKPLTAVREVVRYDDVMVEADRQIADAERAIIDGEAERDASLYEARRALDIAQAELIAGANALAEGEAQLANELAEGLRALLKSQNEILGGERELLESKAALWDGQRQWEDGLREVEDGEKQIAQARAVLRESRAALPEAEATLRLSEGELSAARAELDAGRAEMDAAGAYLSSSKAELNAAKAQLDASKQQIDGLAAGIEAAENMGFSEIDIGDGDIPIDDAKLLLAGYQQAYAAGLAQYNDGMALYEAGRAEYEAGLASYREGERQYMVGLSQYESGLARFQDGLAELEEAEQVLEREAKRLNEGRAELEAKRDELTQAQYALDAAELTIVNAYLLLDQGWREYYAGETEGRAALEAARAALQQGVAAWMDGQRELDVQTEETALDIIDAWAELSDAKRDAADVKMTEWFYSGRDDLPSYSEYYSNTERIAALGVIFPLVFFAVALLISMTTMTRMVDEERGQIGVMKMLGYSRASIMFKYLSYALTSSALGAAVGMLMGRFFFPLLIANAYGILYTMPPLLTPFQAEPQLIGISIMIATTMAGTFFAARAELSDMPAKLLRPKAPKPGKRILLERINAVWRPLPYSWKVTMRNLFRYKQRFLMAITGIAGCTALLITGFGIMDSLNEIAPRQFSSIWRYDVMIAADEVHTDTWDRERVQGVLRDNDASHILWWRQEAVQAEASGVKTEPNIIAVDDADAFATLIALKDASTGEPLRIVAEGAYITDKLASLLDVRAGDTLTFMDEDNIERSVFINGIALNYVDHYIYMSARAYESVMGKEPIDNIAAAVLKDTAPDAQSALAEALLTMDSVMAVVFSSDTLERVTSMFDQLNIIVYVLIALAGALAVAVLYNLNNINLAERAREIATLKVLGFKRSEVSAYILRESLLLTLMGIGVGCVAGRVLHGFVLKTAEVNFVVFPLYVSPVSYLFSGVLTMVFACAVFLMLLPKLEGIDMVESLKSVE